MNQVVDFVGRVTELGGNYFDLCDTLGIATPDHVKELVLTLKKHYPKTRLEAHTHDTRNMGMLNTFAAIECGIDGVQTSLGGLGGCPFAPGASY